MVMTTTTSASTTNNHTSEKRNLKCCNKIIENASQRVLISTRCVRACGRACMRAWCGSCLAKMQLRLSNAGSGEEAAQKNHTFHHPHLQPHPAKCSKIARCSMWLCKEHPKEVYTEGAST
eukprot:2433058-Amphidinium_carterae.1